MKSLIRHSASKADDDEIRELSHDLRMSVNEFRMCTVATNLFRLPVLIIQSVLSAALFGHVWSS